jgi:hypothetical protein
MLLLISNQINWNNQTFFPKVCSFSNLIDKLTCFDKAAATAAPLAASTTSSRTTLVPKQVLEMG